MSEELEKLRHKQYVAERSDWSKYGQQKGTTDDLKAVSKAIIYLKEHELFTLEDLDAALQGMSEKSKGINADMKNASARVNYPRP